MGKRILILPALLAATVMSAVPAGASNSENCPIEKVAGRIDSVQGSPNKIALLRDGKRIPAQVNTCVLYGDRLDAGNVDQIEIDTDDHHPLRIGKLTGQLEWTFPLPGGADPSVIGELKKFYTAITDHTGPYPLPGLSRGCDADGTGPDEPLAALSLTPLLTQRIGADLTVLVVPWTSATKKRSVAVRLVRADGSVLAESSTCAFSYATLSLPDNALNPGDHLALEIHDSGGSSLQWPIIVVTPAQLPKPDGQIGSPWQLSAWRLATGGKDVGLDSLTRLLQDSTRSFAARQVLSRILFEGVH